MPGRRSAVLDIEDAQEHALDGAVRLHAERLPAVIEAHEDPRAEIWSKV